jgi:hypothetical protein
VICAKHDEVNGLDAIVDSHILEVGKRTENRKELQDY